MEFHLVILPYEAIIKEKNCKDKQKNNKKFVVSTIVSNITFERKVYLLAHKFNLSQIFEF